jgi:hypothetical protein
MEGIHIVRGILLLPVVALLAVAPSAEAQPFEVYAAAGPTLIDGGHSVAAGAGYSPVSRLTLLVAFERTHLSSRTRRDRNLVSNFRGGTLWLGSAEVRFAPLGRDRFGPFGLAGFAAGVSHPNVNAIFPNRISNDVRAIFAGGGIMAPLSERVTLFADARMMVGAEGIEGIVAVAPLRAGLAWRF